CAVVTFGALVLLAARWPREEVAGRIHDTFAGPDDHEAAHEVVDTTTPPTTTPPARIVLGDSEEGPAASAASDQRSGTVPGG
ncbi:MAG: hypothetical protein ACTHN8_04640, partial [Angustibacter sp.]